MAKSETKRGRGRPAVERNDDHAAQVQAMSQYGVPQGDIAASIGMCVETMLKLYGNEFKAGKNTANFNIGKRLYDKAIEGDTTALIFWAKTQMGWKETQRVEHAGAVMTGSAYCEEKAQAAGERLKELRREREDRKKAQA